MQHPNGASINFAELRQSGVVGVIIKATEGLNYTNPYYASDAAEAHAAGLHVGFYHFFHPELDPVAQARYFLGAIHGHFYDLRPAMDYEINGGIGAPTAAQRACAFEGALANELQYPPLCYTYPAFANEGYCAGLGRYPLWLANISHSPTPAPWVTTVLAQGPAENRPGVSTSVDIDTTDSLAELLVPAPPSPPPPTGDKVQRIVQVQGNPAQAVTDGMTKRILGAPTDEEWLFTSGIVASRAVYMLNQRQWDDLPNVAHS